LIEGGKGVGGVALRGEDARGKTAVVLGQPLEASLVVRHRSFEASFGERSLKRGGHLLRTSHLGLGRVSQSRRVVRGPSD
jgi:hypothetical protein